MTAQASDQVRHRNQLFALSGVNGSGLFNPSSHGLQPNAGANSSCWRGFVCDYGVSDGGLFL